MKIFFTSLLTLFTLFFTSCSEPPRKPIVVSASIWIGFAPIFYAHASGWLEEANVKMLHTESVGESMAQFESGASDMIAVTQSEFLSVREKHPDFTAAMFLDRSFGGDVIVANRTLEQLHKTDELIDLYLEPNTVNEEMWHYLMKFENFPKERFRLAPRSQDEISRLKSSSSEPPIVAITFNPYDLAMMKNGFVTIASTKDSRYLVVDGIHAKRSFIKEHQEQIVKFKALMERAIEVSQKDPKGFYEKVKPFLNNPTYEEFQEMVKNIEWMASYPSDKIVKQLQEIGYKTEDLVK